MAGSSRRLARAAGAALALALAGYLLVPLAATSATPPADAGRDVVIARRNLMAAVGRNMDGITGMVEPGGRIDPADAAEHADEIAVMLMAFPHLFPSGSDNWTPKRERDDPAGVTEAAPAVWRDAKGFAAMSVAASQIATDASRSFDAAQFRTRAAALQNACDSCHARFRREERPYEIPIAPLPGAKAAPP